MSFYVVFSDQAIFGMVARGARSATYLQERSLMFYGMSTSVTRAMPLERAKAVVAVIEQLRVKNAEAMLEIEQDDYYEHLAAQRDARESNDYGRL